MVKWWQGDLGVGAGSQRQSGEVSWCGLLSTGKTHTGTASQRGQPLPPCHRGRQRSAPTPLSVFCQCPEQGRSPLSSPPQQPLPPLLVAEREALSVPEKRPTSLVRSCPECVHQGNQSFPGGSEVKNVPANAGDAGNALIPGWGRSPGEGNDNPLQYSCLGNPLDRGAWWVTIQGVANSQTQTRLSN